MVQYSDSHIGCVSYGHGASGGMRVGVPSGACPCPCPIPVFHQTSQTRLNTMGYEPILDHALARLCPRSRVDNPMTLTHSQPSQVGAGAGPCAL